MKPYM